MLQTKSESTARLQWLNVMPAVFLMYMISFFDRVNIRMALPHITKEFSLTEVQAGWLGGSFAWGYLVAQLLAGYVGITNDALKSCEIHNGPTFALPRDASLSQG